MISSILLLLSLQVSFAQPVATPEKILEPAEIYALMDAGDWKGAEEAAQQLAQQPTANGLAYLTLGDALSRYPSNEGDIHAAFDAWSQAKALAPKNTAAHRVASERLAWSMEHAALIKMMPMSSNGRRWWDDSFSYALYPAQAVDLDVRTDYMKGGVYVSNLPIGELILEVTPGKGLPTLVQQFTLEAGDFNKIYIPADMAALRIALEQGQFVTKKTGGKAILDGYIQTQLNDEALMAKLSEETVVLPPYAFPRNTSIFLRNEGGNRLPYTYGVSNEVRGGLYVLEIHQEHHVSYADIVVHADLVAPTIQEIVANDERRRAKPERPAISLIPAKTQTSSVSPQSSQPQSIDEASSETVHATESTKDSVAVVDIESTELTDSETTIVPDVASTETIPVDNVEVETPIVSNPEQTFQVEGFAEPMYSDETFVRVNKTLAVGLALSAAYTGTSAYLAYQQIQTANSEAQSQRSFVDASSQAAFWSNQYMGGLIVGGQILGAYATSRWIEYRFSHPVKGTGSENEATLGAEVQP